MAGKVGIGTANPGNYRLAIKEASSSSGRGLRILNAEESKSAQLWVGTGGAVLDAEGTTNLHLRTAGQDRMFVKNDGKVGIGTTDPKAKLHVNGDIRMKYAGKLMANEKTIFEDLSGGGDWLRIGYNDGSQQFTGGVLIYGGKTALGLAVRSNGNVGIGRTDPQSKLDVVGNIRVSDSSHNAVVEIGEGLDYAETFDVTEGEKASPGMVVVIDPEHAGKLRLSTEAYDHKVAGVVAGARGLGSGVRLGRDDGDDHAIALAGRVYCNVDATYGAIEPGDLLTTSPTPGYAMRVSDYTQAQGAILGKAMERLEEGAKGLILVLVTLQ